MIHEESEKVGESGVAAEILIDHLEPRVEIDDLDSMLALAQLHATMAVAEQLGRIADVLESIEVVTTAEEAPAEEGAPDDRRCAWCDRLAAGTALSGLLMAGERPAPSCGAFFCGIEFRAHDDAKPRAARP